MERVGHPLFLIGAMALWWALGKNDVAMLVVLVSTLVLIGAVEQLVPAQPQWRVSSAAQRRLVALYILGAVVSGVLIAGYRAALVPALDGVRNGIGAAIWPGDWPLVVQILLLYLAADFIYYWIHRAIHRSPAFWRLTGHGFHHGFHNLHAINAGTSHPFELVFVVLPLVLLASLFGAPADAVSGAGVLLIVNATLAHANVHMETPGLSWVFTCSNQHRRHHSAVFEDSNTNYACNAILWDRVFGTYSRGPVPQTGIGPTQPGLWRMFLLPFREPEGVDTVVTRTREST
jgi:sterol desaturase/sphingolipid hydroxylase (fatty acid hydroxylase superfamily)